MKAALLAVTVVAAVVVFTLVSCGTDDAKAAKEKPPHHSLWLCVHKNERSAWNDPDPPYYGGLQMGWWFMRTYASRERSPRTAVSDLYDRKGTANRWTPLEQMWVAELAFRREGFDVTWFNGQWPPSRGKCGL